MFSFILLVSFSLDCILIEKPQNVCASVSVHVPLWCKTMLAAQILENRPLTHLLEIYIIGWGSSFWYEGDLPDPLNHGLDPWVYSTEWLWNLVWLHQTEREEPLVHICVECTENNILPPDKLSVKICTNSRISLFCSKISGKHPPHMYRAARCRTVSLSSIATEKFCFELLMSREVTLHLTPTTRTVCLLSYHQTVGQQLPEVDYCLSWSWK